MKRYYQHATWASLCAAAALLAFTSSSASSSQLVYTPNSPSFGGSPFIADFLIGTADRQNRFTEDRTQQFPDITFPDIIITTPEPPTVDDPTDDPTNGTIQTVPQ